jgi:hypothetical protein
MRHIAILLLALPVANAGLRGARDTLSALGMDEELPKTEAERIQRLQKLSNDIDKDEDGVITTAELKVCLVLLLLLLLLLLLSL